MPPKNLDDVVDTTIDAVQLGGMSGLSVALELVSTSDHRQHHKSLFFSFVLNRSVMNLTNQSKNGNTLLSVNVFESFLGKETNHAFIW